MISADIDYLNIIGARQCYNQEKQQKNTVALLHAEWLKYLEDNQFFDPMVSAPNSDATEDAYAVFIYEAQNVPPVGLNYYTKLANQNRCLVALDPTQAFLNSPFCS